jgi:hypothetical protein
MIWNSRAGGLGAITSRFSGRAAASTPSRCREVSDRRMPHGRPGFRRRAVRTRLAAGGRWIRTSGSACHARGPKAVIVGFGCMPPSLDYLRLPSVDISEGGPKRNFRNRSLIPRGTAQPEVRIPLPPAASQLRTLTFGYRRSAAQATRGATWADALGQVE